MKKNILLIIALAFLNACAEYTAVVGPGVTLAKSGSVIHSGASAAAGYVIKKTTGKFPGEHVLTLVKKNPRQYDENKKLHGLILSALADQVYENKINNDQAWILYEDVIQGFNKAKNKTNYLVTALVKYN